MARGLDRRLPFLLLSGLLALLATGASSQPDRRAGVTLFSGIRLTGASQTFEGEVFDLDDTRFGANRAGSVAVAPGCRVTLYERRGFKGRSIELTDNDNDLGNTALGRGTVSSLRVECRGHGWGGGTGGGWSRGEGTGVTLFRDRSRTGPWQTFEGDVPDLSRTHFGSRRASSIDVAPGCVATLFSEPYFKGRSTTFREADNDLGNTRVGEDNAASLRVACRGNGPEPPRGVTLYLYRNRTGASETFSRDVSDLAATPFGARRANSLDLSPGCVATLFSEPGFRGRSTTFRDGDNNLANTEVGGSTARSLRVECRGGGSRPPEPESAEQPGRDRGVTLFRDRRLVGPSETFTADVPDLARTRLGARAASSVAVSPGCVATLFSEPGFRGRSTSFNDADNDLSNTPVGEDAASSLRVSCR